MAEALGIVASILQLVDIAVKGGEYIHDFRHAPQEQKKLLSEVGELRPLLAELQSRISASTSSKMLSQVRAPLVAFELTMGAFTETLRPEDKTMAKISKRLAWMMWNKKEANEYLSKFEQFKSLLNSWLLLDIWDMGQQQGRDQIAVLNSVDTVTTMVNSSVTNMREAEERSRLIEWLSPINFFLRHADVSQTRQAGTGQWLLAHPDFQEWESGSVGTLWCYGIPGAGKTILACMVVDHLNVDPATDGVGVACMYLNHKEADIHTPDKLLAGVWRQLILGREIGSKAKQVYQRHSEKGTKASIEEVHELLRDAIAQYSKVYIVVDAVDEYPEHDRRIVLQRLATVVGPRVSLMITSRPHISPDLSLPNLTTLEIRANEDDIRKYVDAHIEMSARLSKHIQTRPQLRHEIHGQIATTVDGMFLLAKLHIDALSTKSTVKAVREALKSLPTDLSATYEEAMKRIDDQNEEDRTIAHSALMWVANAQRPLRVSDVRLALAIEPGTQQLDDDNILDIELILAVCAGLLIVDEQLDVVRLAHYTTQEYFDRAQAQRFPNAQTDITRRLLTFLSFDGVPKAEWGAWNAGLPPLVRYAQHWPRHAVGRPERELREMILKFLRVDAPRWNKCLGNKWNSPPWSFFRWPQENLSPLWIAAGANLLETVQYLLLAGISPGDCGQVGTGKSDSDDSPLQIAAYYGHLDIARLLIEHGASVTARSGFYKTALRAAATEGHLPVVQLLMKYGAGIDAPGAIRVAADSGHASVVEFFLESGLIDVDLDDGALLHSAVAAPHHELIPLLFQHWASPKARPDTFQLACADCDISYVKLFIERGAKVESRAEDDYGSPLHAACLRGSAEVVQLLLDHGARVNTWVGDWGSPLAAACFGGDEGVVRLLLARGADANAPGTTYAGNPLEAASDGGHAGIVRLLHENGADVNRQTGDYGGALQAAATKGEKLEIVQFLIENGADVNAPGGFYGSPLKAALSYGHQNVARLLLKNGAVSDARTFWSSYVQRFSELSRKSISF
ncbi:ankyrin repeat-containing domain protein [Mycena filopes]|nr:ankyrin repeat-containing domain protein [Mycena filopes]